MPTSRRSFLRLAGTTAAGLPLLALAAEAAEAAEPKSSDAPPVRHAGLLFGPEDLPRIRRALAHPRLAPWWDSVQKADLQADTHFLRSEVRLNNHVKDILQVRQILERTAFVYAVTGSAAQADVARLAVDKLLEYPKWDYFLEGGKDVIGLQRAPEATIAMSCARQWLAPVLSKETAAEMERQIADKGAMACYRTLYGMKYPDRVRGWSIDPEDDYQYRFDLSRWPFILNATNLKVIPIAGLGMAGCLLHDSNPQAQRWIDLAVQSARAFSTMFGPDGAYDEGVGYWGYTALHLTLLFEVLRRTRGMNLEDIINYPGTIRYGLRMSMPTRGRVGDCVNFSDAFNIGDVAVSAWAARRFRDPIAQYVATHVAELKSHYAAIWLDAGRPVKDPGSDLHDVRFSNDWVVARSGWGEDDGVAALRSGGPANHEHADRNSVIFKAYGERIYHDPFHAAYSYTDPLWALRLTESHTAVLIDGKGHEYNNGHEGTNASLAEAHVVDYRSSGGSVVVVSDATQAYQLVNPDVELVQRTMIFLKPDILALVDRVRLKSNPLSVQIRFQIDNSDGGGSVVNAVDGQFEVRRPKACAEIFVSVGASRELRTGALNVPRDKGVFPYAEVYSAPAMEHLVMSVCAVRRLNEAPASIRGVNRNGQLSFKGTYRGKSFEVSIDTSKDLPVVSIK